MICEKRRLQHCFFLLEPCNTFATAFRGSWKSSVPFPKHIIINKVPLIDKTPSFWTIQNFGASISPYRIYNRKEFLGYFERFGYRIVDTWEVPDLSCDIPFHPEHTISRMAGMHLRHG